MPATSRGDGTIAYADPDGNVVTVTERTHEDVADP
jgi:hypothetical protein